MKALLAAAALLATCSAHAAGKDVEDLLAKMRKAYGAVKSATFTTESHFGQTIFINSFSFRGPDKIRLEITSPTIKEVKGALIKVTDGQKIAFKFPGDAPAPPLQDYSLKTYEINLPVGLESLAFFDPELHLSTTAGKSLEGSEMKIEKDKEWEGKKWIVLEESPKDGKTTNRYYVDPKTYFIWRTVVRKVGITNDYQDSWITKMDTAAKLADDLFVIPKGS